MQFRSLIFLLLVLSLNHSSKAQVTAIYGMDTTQSLANYDFLYSLAPGVNGTTWMSGRLEKTLTSSGGQVSEYGSLLEIDQSGNIISSRKSGFRTIKSLAVASDNNLLLAGEGSGFMCTSGMCKTDLLVAKVTPAGTLVWGRSFGNPNYNGSDGFRSVMETSDGHVVAVGNIYQSSLNSHPFVAKINGQTGDTLWTKALGFPSNQFGNHASEGPAGEIFVASSGDLRVVKLTSAGVVSWARAFANYGEVVRLDAQPDGSVIAAGHYLAANGNYNICLFKVSAAGNLEWFYDYNTSLPDHYEFMNAMTPAPGGGYYIAGWHYSNINYTGSIPLVFKTDASGNIEWARTWPSPSGEVTALLNTSTGLVAGIDHLSGAVNNQPDIALVTVDANGSGSCFVQHPFVQASPVITQINSAAYYYGDYETQSTAVAFSNQLFWKKPFCTVTTDIEENSGSLFDVKNGNGIVFIRSGIKGRYECRVSDISGRTVIVSEQSGNSEIETGKLTPGIYLLSIKSGNYEQSFKLIF